MTKRTRRWMRRTRKMTEKARRKTRRTTTTRSRAAQNGQLRTTRTTTRTTSKPRSRKPTTTIDAFSPLRHPAEPLPDSSPLTVFLRHRWRGWRTDLKEKIIIKKNPTWSLASRVQQTSTTHTHTHRSPLQTATNFLEELATPTQKSGFSSTTTRKENLFVFLFTFYIFVHIVKRGGQFLSQQRSRQTKSVLL